MLHEVVSDKVTLVTLFFSWRYSEREEINFCIKVPPRVFEHGTCYVYIFYLQIFKLLSQIK